MKTCVNCKNKYPKTSFNKCLRQKDGLYSYCKECAKIIHKIYHDKYKEKYRKNVKEWYKKCGKEHLRNKRKNNPKFHLENVLASAICASLKGKKAGRKWELLVGYTISDLIKHLELLFDDKMNWDNYGSYWHIDHIKPKSLFKYTCPEDKEFKKCWALKNLQPLEAIKNWSKHNKYIKISNKDKIK